MQLLSIACVNQGLLHMHRVLKVLRLQHKPIKWHVLMWRRAL